MSEEPVFRMGAGHAGRQSRSWVALPGRAYRAASRSIWRYTSVAELSFQRAQRFFLGLAVGDFAIEVGAAFGVGLADLTDRGEMQRVVETTVSALGEPVHDSSVRGASGRAG